jgi:hypothetical protein
MRIIKLSPEDPDMLNREKVNDYFNRKLRARNPKGQFLLKKGWISKKGITEGELIVFSYKGKLKYLAMASSERIDNKGDESNEYPQYFCIDVETITPAKGSLKDLEAILHEKEMTKKSLVKCQGWPIIKESPEVKKICESFKAQ